MYSLYGPRTRAERLVAAGRIVLAVSSLLAVWIDPSEPARHSQIAYGLLVAYVCYSMGVAVLVWRSEAPSEGWRVASHAFDLAFFSLFIYFTAGPASPFNAYFVFALVCGTLRWQWWGAVWTAVVSLLVLVGVTLYFRDASPEPAFELSRLIIRGVYMAVVAVLLAYLGSHELQSRRDMALLATWPYTTWQEAEPLAKGLLAYAASVLDSPRAVAMWNDRTAEGTSAFLAEWRGGQFELTRESGIVPLVAEPLAEAHFLCNNLQGPEPAVRWGTSAELRQWQGAPLHPELARRFAAGTVLSLRLAGQSFEGRLFFLDRPGLTVDDLVIGEILAGVVTSRFDHFYLLHQLQQTAAVEERIRLARDLHDGVLQSFTGIGLRLETVRRLIVQDRPAAVHALEEAQRLIASEHRDLRFFIEELKPSAAAPALEGADDLARRLGELVERMEREWDLRVELHAHGLREPVPDALARDIYHIVREAMVNAVRHGKATEVRVEIGVADSGELAVSVADNGRGFPFVGLHSSEALARMNLGPRTLRERVTALRGTLTVESTTAGARLDVLLPLAAT